MLPEPLAGLVLHLVAARQGHATTGDQGTSPWLLPGGRPGQPISPCRLSERLRQIGIRPGSARSTALFQLATELPAAILARMLGIHIDVAVAWQRVSAGDWMTYAADVSRRRGRLTRWPTARTGHSPRPPLVRRTRPPAARDQVRVECDVAPRHLTIVESRPPWREGTGPEWTRFPIARLRYTQADRTWSLYWRDRNLRFHRYDQLAPSPHIDDLLQEIDRDPTAIFWG